MQMLEVRGEREGARVHIHASGELDLATAPQLEACARAHIHAHTETVEFDLREVGFIDSTGVRLLLMLATQGERDDWTLTIQPSGVVHRTIGLLGLQQQLLPPHLQAVEAEQSSAA